MSPDRRGADDVDLIIAGAGAAGLSAAIEALSAPGEPGIDVLVVDSDSAPGGAAAIAGGGVFIAGSPLQREAGITDSPAQAIAEWIAMGGPETDSEWMTRYVSDSVPEVYDWCAGLGVRWQRVEFREGNSVARWHRPVGGGAGIAGPLISQAEARGVSWKLSATVTDVLQRDGAVTGLAVRAAAGAEELHAPAVIIATGGFVNNPAMLLEHSGLGPDARFLCGGAPHATGGGHEVLGRAGAEFSQLDKIWFYPFGTPNYRLAGSGRGLAVRGLTNNIWLDHSGRRFHNESLSGGATGGRALLRQPGQTCWTLFDRAEKDKLLLRDDSYYGVGDDIRRDRIEEFLGSSPYVSAGRSAEEAAAAAGLPAADVAETVRAFNASVSAGERTDALGRDLTGLRPLDRAPFYLMQYFPLAQKNLGGVRTDLSGLVQRVAGEPLAGLYAAGEVAGMAGGHINGAGALEGTMLGPSLYSGRVAGRAAARYAAGVRGGTAPGSR